MSGKNKKYSFIETVILIALITLFIFISVGFWGMDPYALKRFGKIYLFILWGLRIGIPVFVLIILGLYYGIKKESISGGNIVLLVMGIFIAGLLFYPFLNYYYNAARIKDKISEYHPYLQLNPVLPIDEIQKENLNIIFLGGSTTEFKDSKKRGWPDRVQELLINRSNKENIRAYNMGRQWYTTLHTLINYETNFRDVKPDVIVVMHGINDLLHNADFSYFSHGSFREDYGHFYGPVDLLITGRNFIKVLYDRIDFWYYKPREVVDQTQFPGLIPFEQNLNSIIDLAEIDGSKVVLMTQPNILKEKMTDEELDHLYMLNTEAVGHDKRWSLKSAFRGMELYNESIRKVARERNIPLIDLEKVIPKSLEYFYDEVHYQDKTYDMIAEYVAGELVKMVEFETQTLGHSQAKILLNEEQDE